MTGTYTIRGSTLTFTDGQWSGPEGALRFLQDREGTAVFIPPVGPVAKVDLAVPQTVLALLESIDVVEVEGEFPAPPWGEDDPDARGPLVY